jgi:lipase chaperone LimK
MRLAAALTAALLAVFFFWPRAESPRAPRPLVTGAPAPATPTAPPLLAASLGGTLVDGEARVADDGELVVDLELRRLFDYYLAAHGEEDLAVTRARIEAALEARLGPRGAAEAKEILARYLAYRDAASRLAADGDLRTRLAALATLRRQILGDRAAQAFFGLEEAEVALSLERQKILEDITLDDATRQAALAEAEAKAPAEVEAAYVDSTAALAGMEAEKELRARGASSEEIQADRTLRFGAEAAERLRLLDEQRAAWKVRLDDFRATKARLERELGPEAARAEIATIRARDFTPAEQIRVETLVP